MLNKAANVALRIIWETVALFSGVLLGAVPMILLAAALAWVVSDPGCSCYSQKIVLAKVKIEEYKILVCSVAAIAGIACWLLLRRFKFTARDLLDVLFCLVVFAGVYFVGAAILKDATSPGRLLKIPFEMLAPVWVQQGFEVPYFTEPYFFPWKTLYRFIDSWQFIAAAFISVGCFLVFGESFGSSFSNLFRRSWSFSKMWKESTR
jgi:hypothetical protein